jgi:hypothetical protein
MRSWRMFRPFRKSREQFVFLCERCASACDAACRADAIRDRARERSLAYGWRYL